jgi:hypothetical protein
VSGFDATPNGVSAAGLVMLVSSRERRASRQLLETLLPWLLSGFRTSAVATEETMVQVHRDGMTVAERGVRRRRDADALRRRFVTAVRAMHPDDVAALDGPALQRLLDHLPGLDAGASSR